MNYGGTYNSGYCLTYPLFILDNSLEDGYLLATLSGCSSIGDLLASDAIRLLFDRRSALGTFVLPGGTLLDVMKTRAGQGRDPIGTAEEECALANFYIEPNSIVTADYLAFSYSSSHSLRTLCII
jgi:hypothetical protein